MNDNHNKIVEQIDSTPMFIGTFNELSEYINDYVKNKIPNLTRKYRTRKCDYCGCENVTLDSAHLRNRERPVLMKEVWDSLAVKTEIPNVCKINMADFARKIDEVHSDPNNFYFLCKKCHREYDRDGSTMPDTFERKGGPVIKIGGLGSGKMAKSWPFYRNKSGVVALCNAKEIETIGFVAAVSIKKKQDKKTSQLYAGKEVFWADINTDKLNKDITFILNNQDERRIHVIKIPADKFNPDLTNARYNGKLWDVNITTDSLTDVDTRYNFALNGETTEFEYNDEDIALYDI